MNRTDPLSSMDMLHNLISDHPGLITIILLISVVTIVGSMIALPWLILSLPAHYFSEPSLRGHTDMNPVLKWLWLVFKNLCGIVLLIAGIAMLILPGQGLLTILGGLLLMDFPGKYELECRLARQPVVFKAMNWIRKKGNKPLFN
jgi:hypothetical protein